MATYGQTIRRGLPRLPGGDPWPPSDTAPLPAATDAVAAATVAVSGLSAPLPLDSVPIAVESALVVADSAPVLVEDVPVPAGGLRVPVDGARRIRRGLPRVPGGEPWPPAATAPVVAPASVAVASAPDVVAPAAAVLEAPATATAPAAAAVSAPAAASAPVGAPARQSEPAAEARALRRGLPRVAGGEPWPPAGFAPGKELAEAEAPATPRDIVPRPAASVVPVADLSAPLPFTRTVFPGRAAVAFERERLTGTRVERPEPARIGPFTRLQWLGAAIVGGGGLLFAAGMAVVVVRWLLSLDPMQDFLVAYPGEYPLPEGAPVGIPPWLGWQHFFNTFLIVLIIRSGLQVRTEKRPSVFWSPRGNGRRKISLNLWFHQSLDILWVTNGVIYIVLLFATGQWMKIVPTSWSVFPNALSAALQYVSLDWPTENGWVNYNSLQQLAYFATVFIAAPLAIATGVRMSGIWPKNATALNKAYPVEWARRVHFPVMIYFVAFIFVHVVLVFATNALRNLNHMYASQDAVNWVGFWIFAASLVVIAAAWVAARPLVLAPIARLFGSVSGR